MIRLGLMLLAGAGGLFAQAATPMGPANFPAPAIGDANKNISGKPGAKPASAPSKATAPAAPHAASSPTATSYRDLKYPPLRPIQMPRLDASTLPNGMRLYLWEDHELPLVTGMALVRAGTLLDPPGKAGLASLAVTAMRIGGAGSTSGDQVDQWLEDTAATIETTVTADLATLTFSTLPESTTEVLGIFKDVLTQPRFEDGKIDRARAEMRNAMTHRNDDAARIANREISTVLYGSGTPFGHEQDFTGIGSLLRSDLEAFHARYFTPGNTVLAIRGDFDSAQMKAQIAKLFESWKAQEPAPDFPQQPSPAKDAPGIHVAVKRDISQSFFAVGQIGGTLNDKDNAALGVMTNVLGGPSPNRLLQDLATQSSHAEVTARWEPGYALPGIFVISGSTAAGATTGSVKAIQDDIARIRSAEITDDELKAAKDAAINSLLFSFDTKEKAFNRLLMAAVYGYPADFYEQYQRSLEAVTRADVLRVAKEHLHPEAFATVLVGDPGDFAPPLTSLNQPLQPIDLAIPELKLAAVKSDAGSAARGKTILARLQQAIGGLDKLAALKDTTLVANYKVDRAGQVTTIKHTERWIAPMHYREENELGGGTIAAYFDGQFGWITVPGGSVPLSGLSLLQLQGNAFRQVQLLLQAGTLPGTGVNAVDERTVEITGPAGQWARVTADPTTGLPVKLRYEGASASGPPQAMEETWSDFREFSGVKIPFTIVITQAGRKYADVSLVEFRANSGLKLADLEKRP